MRHLLELLSARLEGLSMFQKLSMQLDSTHTKRFIFREDIAAIFSQPLSATSLFQFSNKLEMVLFPLDFSKQRDFMPQLAALCEQFVLDIPETQRVIYIASCNSFFFPVQKLP